MRLGRKLSTSILNMGIQRALDFVTLLLVTTMVVRSLGRQEYGILSVVLSYGLVFNILNVSVSSVLVRDFGKLAHRVGDYLHAFVLFAAFKSIVVLVLSVGIGAALYRRYHDPAVVGVVAVQALGTSLLYLAEPYTTVLSVDFRQSVLTRIATASSVANLALSAGALLFPTALFVAAKNAAVALLGLVLTAGAARRAFRVGAAPPRAERLRLIKQSFVGFSLWSHLIGVVTDLIYRADLLILGWLGPPLRTVGNYNIALQMANFTKVLPQILQYNATLGVSHTPDVRRREELTFIFVKYSLFLSIATIAAYVLLGRLAIRLIAGTGVEEIYELGFYIIAGLCLYNTFRPLIAYCIVVHDIRECFLFAILPSGIGTMACYGAMGAAWGAHGLAVANLCGGAIMSAFTLAYLHLRTTFTWRFSLVTPAERDLALRLYSRLRGYAVDGTAK